MYGAGFGAAACHLDVPYAAYNILHVCQRSDVMSATTGATQLGVPQSSDHISTRIVEEATVTEMPVRL
jgi:hypothetical protein